MSIRRGASLFIATLLVALTAVGAATWLVYTEAGLAWCRERGIGHLILWSDTRFDLAHRLYTRMGFTRAGERTVIGDVNDSREYFFERPV